MPLSVQDSGEKFVKESEVGKITVTDASPTIQSLKLKRVQLLLSVGRIWSFKRIEKIATNFKAVLLDQLVYTKQMHIVF